MSPTKREVFLTDLYSELISRHPDWQIEDHCKIEWDGHPRNLWPEADIAIIMPGRQFIVEYDEDSDPGRNLIKYWPVLDNSNLLPLTIIEIWKKGNTIGQGYASLAQQMGTKMMELHPGSIYVFIERNNESAMFITDKIEQIILGKNPR